MTPPHPRRGARHSLEPRLVERRLEALADFAPAAIVMLDAQGRVLSLSRGGRTLFGVAPAQALGKPLARLLPELGRGRVQALLHSGARDGAGRSAETNALRADGEPIPVEATFFSWRERGETAHAAIIRDISVQRRAAEADRLRESERLQREFVANVSHELRTPVAAILGFAETLLNGALDDPRSRRSFVRIIEKHALRLSALIEDLLHLSVLESGRRRVRKKRAALEPLLRRFAAGLAPLMRRKALTLRLAVQPGLSAAVDPPQLEQVLQNLVSNAVKFSRPRGVVTVSARRHGAQAAITVADTGRGIPAERLPTIFQRFNRPERRGAGGGTGLGLSIAKEIVLAHGGRIWAESARGKGAAFHFTVPRPSKS